MRTLISFFVFIAITLTGVSGGSAAEIEKIPANSKKIQNEIKELEEKQKEHPYDADLQFILGSDYWVLDNHDKAIEHYNRALELDPEYDPALWNLSVLYNQKGDGAEAIIHMKKVEAIFLKRQDVKSLANARKKLRELFTKYPYQPEDFELQRGFFRRIFN
jgi:tetratricopeptide (TPR) repeat protein